MDLKSVVSLRQNLMKEWDKKPHDLAKCGQLLAELKLALMEMNFQPGRGQSVSESELLLARDTLEIAAFHAIESKDTGAFERAVAMLRPYYFDYGAASGLAASNYKYEILGLNLLCLLAQNRLSDFHCEIERLPVDEVMNNHYLKHPIQMEQFQMEGAYNKIFLIRDNVPAEHYKYFIDILLNTIRDEIAECLESAYDSIDFDECSRMLFFKTQQEMLSFVEHKSAGSPYRWLVESVDSSKRRKVSFVRQEATVSPVKCSQATTEVAQRVLWYARQMEQIV